MEPARRRLIDSIVNNNARIAADAKTIEQLSAVIARDHAISLRMVTEATLFGDVAVASFDCAVCGTITTETITLTGTMSVRQAQVHAELLVHANVYEHLTNLGLPR